MDKVLPTHEKLKRDLAYCYGSNTKKFEEKLKEFGL